MIGDIIGKPGRRFVNNSLEHVKSENNIDFVIANGENCAGGFGITEKITIDLLSHGVDVITSGNHIWKNKDVLNIIDIEPRLLRPLNYPDEVPGKGYHIYTAGKCRILVINLMGRFEMMNIDCPFRKINTLLDYLQKEDYDISIVDFHAEATSEKVAMGWFLNGRVSAVLGTHTHIQTADEKILDKDTAYISDVGMSGSFNSVLGVEKERIIHHFLTRMPVKFKISKTDVGINSVIVQFDIKNKKTVKIERFNLMENSHRGN